MNEKLVEKLEEIYEKTIVKIPIGDKIIDSFENTEGVRQGCPLSPVLYNIAVSDLEETMRQVQGGGVSMRKERVRSIAYADDTQH